MARILLIEDHEANRDLTSRYLEHFSHEVIAVTNGRDALGLAQAPGAEFDAILMALTLPDMDGTDLARLLKNHPVSRLMPLIAMTAHAMVGDRERILATGCDECVTKPIDFARLIEIINALCHHGAST